MSTNLPQLGRRGEGWLALQMVLLAVIFAAGIRGSRWPSSARAARRAAVAVSGFLDAKRRREEAWLVKAHPEYEAYRAHVRHIFVPFVW